MFEKFIQRPVLSIAISLAMVFLGILAITTRPISQFPEIAPPRVSIFIEFPGSNAEVLIKSTVTILERAINGVQGMQYIISDATSAGEATVQIIFEPGTDPTIAAARVKTRVDQVWANLPLLVQREGVIITPIQPSMLMYINLFSKDKHTDQKFLFNYAKTYIIPELQRIFGVGRAEAVGSRSFAIRVWLKPDRMRAYKISAEEVLEAIDEQSFLARPGRVGLSSGIKAQSLEYVLTYQGWYNKPEQYKEIILKANPEGEILRLKDVADVEVGSEFVDIYTDKDGLPTASLVLKQNPGSNANKVIEEVKAKLEELKADFPPNMEYEINYDVSKFVNASIEKVLHTLVEAFVLVALVVFIFLGDWRSTLIPTLAVPVSLIGTFMFMQLFDLSINLVTLFALVLAIGIVVDNAIVVVEAVHVKMGEENLSPLKAVKKVLGEISGAIIAITLVMTAVFVPVAFMTGPVGVLYRQFSITMATAIVLSGVIALTLTPVLCAMILKNNHGKEKQMTPVDRFIVWFNKHFDKLTGKYESLLKLIVNRRVITYGVLIVFAIGIVGINKILPAGFIPGEDQGQFYAIIQTPPGTTLERTNEISLQLEKIAKEIPEVQSVTAMAGYEILSEGRGSNAGTCLINLKDWSDRELSVKEVIEELEVKTKDLGAVVEFFEPPAVPGYGASSGFALRLLDKESEVDYQEFDKVNTEFVNALKERKELTGIFSFYAANYPQYELIVDNELAMQKGVSIGKAMENLNILIGSTYEQGFIRFNNYYKVYTQADPKYRRLPSDILKLFVKNEEGEMVPYSSFMKIKKTQGPNEIARYNLYTSALINGVPALGYTSGDAINIIKEVAKKTLPKGYDIAWEGLSYDESRRGNEALYIFIVVVFFVYLILAAQYESFLLPLAVLLSLPPGIFGSFLLLKMMGLSNDVYAQIGLIMLAGLLGKNAVLIVEFAVQKRLQGATIIDAAVEGAKVRFRPILMTSFAFIAGLIPLVIATGPGAVGNHTIGVSALGGMLFGTVFGVIVVPGLYYIFAKLADGKSLIKDQDENPLSEAFIEENSEDSLIKKIIKKIGLKNSKKLANKSLIIGLLAFVFYGCNSSNSTVMSENRNTPIAFKNNTDTTNSAAIKWKEYFADDNLAALIDTALKNNQELKIISQEIEISKSEVRARKGEYLPSIGIGGAAEFERVPKYTWKGAVEENLDIQDHKDVIESASDYSVGLYAKWELDIWKKLRNAKKSAVNRYLAEVEGKNFMVTKLISEIAETYYELLALDNILEITNKSIDAQTKILNIVRQQKEAAEATQLAVNRFEAQLLNTQSLQFQIVQKITEAENRIYFLTGRFPTKIQRNSTLFIGLSVDNIKEGVPSQLLLNRPDIRKAELELAASKLDVKVARSNFYPSLGINANVGFQAFNPSYIVNPESMVYNLAGDLIAPLINRSAISATLKISQAKQIQTVYEYEKTILNAYVDVLNQLSLLENIDKSYKIKSKQVEILTQSIAISNNLYTYARADYGEVLLTQREALESKIELIEIKLRQMTAKVNIYRALGGGWN
ncbi:MAG: efflux RND transporter permease subunit [Flavobacteriales bacterium]|nr:efflux RND transporter permease subunit [Flavobacteriales bacterium]